MNLIRLFIFIVIAFAIPRTGSAAVVLDQSNLESYFIYTQPGAYHYQQQITAGMSGKLDHIDLFTGAGSANIRIKMGDAAQTTGPWLFDQVLNFVAGTNSIDLSSLAISVASGDTFVLDWNGASGGIVEPSFGFSFTNTNSDYEGGSLWKEVNGVLSLMKLSIYSYDMRFQTFVQEAAVPVATPEPATMALLGVGLAGLVMVRRRKAA